MDYYIDIYYKYCIFFCVQNYYNSFHSQYSIFIIKKSMINVWYFVSISCFIIIKKHVGIYFTLCQIIIIGFVFDVSFNLRIIHYSEYSFFFISLNIQNNWIHSRIDVLFWTSKKILKQRFTTIILFFRRKNKRESRALISK
jgi:hypothetical protein